MREEEEAWRDGGGRLFNLFDRQTYSSYTNTQMNPCTSNKPSRCAGDSQSVQGQQGSASFPHQECIRLCHRQMCVCSAVIVVSHLQEPAGPPACTRKSSETRCQSLIRAHSECHLGNLFRRTRLTSAEENFCAFTSFDSTVTTA